MDTDNINPMTQALADILIEDMRYKIDYVGIPREIAIFIMGQFLADYENNSLIFATLRLTKDLSQSRAKTEPYFLLTPEEIASLPVVDKAQMKAEVEVATTQTILLEAVLELVSPL